MSEEIKRINKRCANYPCHKGLEDCTFCFCPLYPCLNPNRGGYVLSKKQNRKVWSCRDCGWIHKKEVVDGIFLSIRSREAALSDVRYFKHRENTGIVILAHGSRIDKTKETVRGIVESLKKNLRLKHILPAYLQFCTPTLPEAAARLVGKKCRKIIIVPCFLFNGNHVTRDIPSLIEKEKERFPGVDILYTKALAGDEQKISCIVAQRIEEVF